MKKPRLRFQNNYYYEGSKIIYNCFGLPEIHGIIEQIAGDKRNPIVFVRTSTHGLASMRLSDIQTMNLNKEKAG